MVHMPSKREGGNSNRPKLFFPLLPLKTIFAIYSCSSQTKIERVFSASAYTSIPSSILGSSTRDAFKTHANPIWRADAYNSEREFSESSAAQFAHESYDTTLRIFEIQTSEESATSQSSSRVRKNQLLYEKSFHALR